MQIHVFRYDIFGSPNSGAHSLYQELGAALHRSANAQFDGAKYDIGYRNVIGQSYLRLLGNGWKCSVGVYLLDQFSRSLSGDISMRMFFEDIDPLSNDQSVDDVEFPQDGYDTGGYVTVSDRYLTLMVYIEPEPREGSPGAGLTEFDPWLMRLHHPKDPPVAEGCHYALVEI